MDWVKLRTTYYNDAAIMRAGEAAEILFVRALAYCGEQENDGLVPREVLPRLCPTRGLPRARALVREGVWAEVPEGWRFVSWDKHQTTREQLEQTREDNRRRQATWRANRKGERNGVTNPVSDAVVTGTEVEVEVEQAAAAREARSTTGSRDLPPAVAILRGALEVRKLVVRWDRLSVDDLAEIEQLVETHGDAALVASAMREFQPDKPVVFAQAWLAGWRQLRKPGDLVVVDDPCPEPGHTGTVRHCIQCASEEKAAAR